MLAWIIGFALLGSLGAVSPVSPVRVGPAQPTVSSGFVVKNRPPDQLNPGILSAKTQTKPPAGFTPMVKWLFLAAKTPD